MRDHANIPAGNTYGVGRSFGASPKQPARREGYGLPVHIFEEPSPEGVEGVCRACSNVRPSVGRTRLVTRRTSKRSCSRDGKGILGKLATPSTGPSGRRTHGARRRICRSFAVRTRSAADPAPASGGTNPCVSLEEVLSRRQSVWRTSASLTGFVPTGTWRAVRGGLPGAPCMHQRVVAWYTTAGAGTGAPVLQRGYEPQRVYPSPISVCGKTFEEEIFGGSAGGARSVGSGGSSNEDVSCVGSNGSRRGSSVRMMASLVGGIVAVVSGGAVPRGRRSQEREA